MPHTNNEQGKSTNPSRQGPHRQLQNISLHTALTTRGKKEIHLLPPEHRHKSLPTLSLHKPLGKPYPQKAQTTRKKAIKPGKRIPQTQYIREKMERQKYCANKGTR